MEELLPARPLGPGRHLLVWVLCVLAYGALTYPALLSFNTHYLCDGGDGVQNIWNIWWVQTALAAGESPWFTDRLFHPSGVTLIGATLNPFNGFLAVPLSLLFTDVQVFNLVVLFSYAGTGYFTFLLIHELVPRFWPALFGGAAFTFSSYHLAHGIGHLQLVSLEWVPCFLWLWVRFLRRPRYLGAVLCGLTLGLVVLCDYYYLLYSVAAGALLLVHHGWVNGRPLFFVARDYLPKMATFVGVSLLAVGPLVVALALANRADELLGAHEVDFFLNDLVSVVVPGANWRWRELTSWFWEGHRQAEFRAEFASCIGPTVLACGGYGLWVARRHGDLRKFSVWIAIGLVFFAMSLGPVLRVWNHDFPSVPMPYDLAMWLVPPLKLGGTPVRFSVMYLLAAAVVAAYGLARMVQNHRLPRWLVVPFVALFLVERCSQPQPLFEGATPPVVHELAKLPDGAVIGFRDDATNLWYQIVHGKPVEHGYIARRPRSIWERRNRVLDLLARERFVEAMELTRARYLVRERIQPGPALQDLAMLYSHDDHEIYVRPDDPLLARGKRRAPCDPAAAVAVRVHDHGRFVDVAIEAPDHAGRLFVAAFSPHRSPEGDQILGFRWPLRRDALTARLLARADRFARNDLGVLDAAGRARVRIDRELWGDSLPAALWCAVAVVGSIDPPRVCAITEPIRVAR